MRIIGQLPEVPIHGTEARTGQVHAAPGQSGPALPMSLLLQLLQPSRCQGSTCCPGHRAHPATVTVLWTCHVCLPLPSPKPAPAFHIIGLLSPEGVIHPVVQKGSTGLIPDPLVLPIHSAAESPSDLPLSPEPLFTQISALSP